ncbi:MAG: hypothetical protein ACRELX_01530 [Longimicrobiales bacterium]
MDALLGVGNTLFHYVLLLLVYAGLFLVIWRATQPGLDPAFRPTFLVLFVGWGFGTFVGNYLLHRAGVMSFLPWLNNGMHTFVWIGVCLGYLYAGVHRRPMLQQFAVFAIFSFVVKVVENLLLGTWEHDRFFFIPGNAAYIIGWSLADGLYPVLSLYGLRLIRKFAPKVVAPSIA